MEPALPARPGLPVLLEAAGPSHIKPRLAAASFPQRPAPPAPGAPCHGSAPQPRQLSPGSRRPAGTEPRLRGPALRPAALRLRRAAPPAEERCPARVCIELAFPFPRRDRTFPPAAPGPGGLVPAEDAGVAAEPAAPAVPQRRPAGRGAPARPRQVPGPLRCLQVPQPQLPQRLRPRPLRLLPHLRRGRGGLVRPQGGPALRGQPGLPLPHGQALRQGRVPVQAQRPGVRQRRPDLRQHLPAEGGEPQGAAARAARRRPGPEGSL